MQSPKRRRERIAEDGRLLPKGTTATDVHQRPLEEDDEMRRRRLEKAQRILAEHVQKQADHYGPRWRERRTDAQ